MDINGTVTISLNDYSKLHRLAKQGIRHTALHEELLDKLSRCVTDIVYDPDMDSDQAARVIEKVRMMSRSLPQVNFYSDGDNKRVIIKLREDPS